MVLVVPIFDMGSVVYAQENSQTIAVGAVVEPHVYLVVNDNKISQVFSNGHQEVEPIVLSGNLNGLAAQMSPEIANQYNQLKNSLDFSKYGVLYQKLSLIGRVLKNALVQSKIF